MKQKKKTLSKSEENKIKIERVYKNKTGKTLQQIVEEILKLKMG
ncbi:hypothetical protein [Clostridium ganghwense]|uniref:Uncharacterized protein n=1 Tax=Clostridium ganghwense TaxID=312089 RepID=A0ABT4CNK7_9CLOT|nr:hypothetical protein [Clostridium ganghwense]MCY6370644.1 hypothetical protein [Clostridium ganghwense]